MERGFKTKDATKSDILISKNWITHIEATASGSYIHIMGGGYITSLTPYSEAEKMFEEYLSVDQFGSTNRVPWDFIQYEQEEVGIYKFALSVRSTKHEDGISTKIILDANFPLKDGAQIIGVIERTNGVDLVSTYGNSKYQAIITIGKLFDSEDVVKELTENIKKYLLSL